MERYLINDVSVAALTNPCPAIYSGVGAIAVVAPQMADVTEGTVLIDSGA